MADLHNEQGVLGAVLVGGSSRRMGRPKALIRVDGSAMVDRMGAVLRAAGCSRVVAVGPTDLAGQLEHVEDLYPGDGPLGGVLAAMSVSGSIPLVCVVACDLMWLDVDSVASLILVARADADADVVAAYSDRLEPLCAVWRVARKPVLQAQFDSGERAVHRAIGALLLRTCELPVAALRNVNTPDDLSTQ